MATPFDLLRPVALAASEVAMVDTNARYSRQELMGRAAGVAARIAALSETRHGQRVIVSLDKGPDFFAGLVGCWMAGAIPVLLDPMVRTELTDAVAMTEASAAIVPLEKRSKLPDGVTGIVPDGDIADVFREMSEIGDTDVVLYLFTSGSTGKPTLVPKRFSELRVEIDFISRLFNRPKRVSGLIPWCHIWGLLSSFFVPLRMGGVCDLRGGISARDVLSLVSSGDVDLVAAVPIYYQAMVRLMTAGGVSVVSSSCRFASSSAPLTPAIRREFRRLTGCGITDIYGSTEAGGIAYRHDDGPWIPEPHVEIRIDDDGMLDVRSPSVSFDTADGFFRTGDLVRREGQGFVLLGRGDDVVKIGGRRIALGEIKTVIESMPGVSKVAVLTETISGAAHLIAVVEADGDGPTASAVKTHVRSRLADHKVPRVVRFVDTLPMMPSGKLDRQRLIADLENKESR